jgi:hypothetical protein
MSFGGGGKAKQAAFGADESSDDTLLAAAEAAGRAARAAAQAAKMFKLAQAKQATGSTKPDSSRVSYKRGRLGEGWVEDQHDQLEVSTPPPPCTRLGARRPALHSDPKGSNIVTDRDHSVHITIC